MRHGDGSDVSACQTPYLNCGLKTMLYRTGEISVSDQCVRLFGVDAVLAYMMSGTAEHSAWA